MAKSKWDSVQEKLPLIESWYRDGAIDEDVYKKLAISKDTFYRYVKEHSDLSDIRKKGKEVIDVQVENALLKRALGYEYEETTQEIRKDEDGKKKTVVKKVTKHVAGDVAAQIFWLNNRRPDSWMNKRDITNELEDLSDVDGDIYG